MGPQGIDKIQAIFDGDIRVAMARGRATGQSHVWLERDGKRTISSIMRPLIEAGLATTSDGNPEVTQTNPDDPVLVLRSATGEAHEIHLFCEDLHADTSL